MQQIIQYITTFSKYLWLCYELFLKDLLYSLQILVDDTPQMCTTNRLIYGEMQ